MICQVQQHIKPSPATSITQVIFNKDDQNIVLSVDVNYSTNCMVNYKDIHDIAYVHKSNKYDDTDKFEFSNQTIGAISMQLRKHYEHNSKGIKLSKKTASIIFK